MCCHVHGLAAPDAKAGKRAVVTRVVLFVHAWKRENYPFWVTYRPNLGALTQLGHTLGKSSMTMVGPLTEGSKHVRAEGKEGKQAREGQNAEGKGLPRRHNTCSRAQALRLALSHTQHFFRSRMASCGRVLFVVVVVMGYRGGYSNGERRFREYCRRLRRKRGGTDGLTRTSVLCRISTSAATAPARISRQHTNSRFSLEDYSYE